MTEARQLRMLVAGATGQLALSLAALDESEPGLSIIACGPPELDLEQPGTLAAAVQSVGPNVVVNAAAYTAVDAAETNVTQAFAINAEGAGALAAAAANAGLPVIHISTDYVFKGDTRHPYHEDDLPDPRTVYGRSKLAGETAVAAVASDCAILRTAWLYSPYGSNFVKTMLRLAHERDSIKVVSDQSGNPTYASDLASAIVSIARRLVDEPRNQALRGIFHVAGRDSVTWADFATEIMRQASGLGRPAARIVPIGSHEYPAAASRPKNSRLETSKVRMTFGVELPGLQDSLAQCLRHLLADAPAG